MSRLEKLIQEYCPDGVEYKRIGEISNYRRGSFPQPYGNLEWYDGEGAMPFVQVADIRDDLKLADDTKRKISMLAQPKSVFAPKDTVVVSLQGTIGRVAITQYDAYIDRTVAIFQELKKDINIKCFVYQLQKVFSVKAETARGSTIKTITKEELTDFSIPVPPLPVQEEIVRILDSFTKLTAELQARKKQYEYYRENAFRFGDGIQYKTMGELFPNIRNGFVGTVTPYYTDSESGVRYLQGTNIHNGVISDNEVVYVTNEFHKKHIKNKLKSDDILMVQSGHIGECAVVGKKYEGCNCHALIIMSNGGECLSKYIVHYFHTFRGMKSLTHAITGGTIKHVLAGKIGKTKVPVPSIDKQREIVFFLDRFEHLINDLSSGLPAEIEARQKQYEYYRDKLLNFKVWEKKTS